LTINRRDFLCAACALPALLAHQAHSRALILLTSDDAEHVRASLDATHREIFEHLAAEALHAGPWSVTYHRPQGGLTQAGLHDYFSEGPYWWPNPSDPKAPYIRRDGERNPGRFIDNHRDMDSVSNATLALGVGAFFLNNHDYAEHAGRILSVWFVDPATRMNPNLEHGQAIRGVNDGRGTGLIDTVSLIRCVQGLTLLEAAGGPGVGVMPGVRQWFRDFLDWMTTSKKGLDEKKSGNNHATWWAAQVAAYASFLGDEQKPGMVFDDYRTYLVPSEIRPNGSCPREEARTNSLSYSCFNLDAFSVLCRIAQVRGIDLWHFTARDGGSIGKACDYLLPFVLHPESWSHQQIGKFNADSIVFPALAGLGLYSQELLDAYKTLPHAKTAWHQFIDALVQTTPGS
jgi:hypothetical protein